MEVKKKVLQRYAAYKKEREAAAFEFYQVDGKIPENLTINYVHCFSVGGSEDAALLDLSDWQTKNDVYELKTSSDFAEPEDKFVFDRGHALEPFVASQFSKLTKIKVKPGSSFSGDAYSCPWSYAQVDFLTEEDIPVEIKVATQNRELADGKSFGVGCDFNSTGVLVDEDDRIPPAYFIQCQKQLWLTDKSYMWLAVWITTETKIRVFKIHRSDEVINKIQEAELSLILHVLDKKPYPIEEALLQQTEEEKCVFADTNFMSLIANYRDVQSQLNELKKESEQLSEKIKKAIGENEKVVDGQGHALCTFKTIVSRRFNAAKFKDAMPEVYSDFIEETESKRLTLSKSKKD